MVFGKTSLTANHDKDMNHMNKKHHMQNNKKHQMMMMNDDPWMPFIVEVNGGAFWPANKSIRTIAGGIVKQSDATNDRTRGLAPLSAPGNGDWWGAFQFKFSISVCHDADSLWRKLYAFASVNYNGSRGNPIIRNTMTGKESFDTNSTTLLHNIPVTVGLRGVHPFECLGNYISGFVGLGVQANIVTTTNKNLNQNNPNLGANERILIPNPKSTAVGGLFEVGFYGHIHENILLSFTVDYSFSEHAAIKNTTNLPLISQEK